MSDDRIILRPGGRSTPETPTGEPAAPRAGERETLAVLRPGQSPPPPPPSEPPLTIERAPEPSTAVRREGRGLKPLLLAGLAALAVGVGVGLWLTARDDDEQPAAAAGATETASTADEEGEGVAAVTAANYVAPSASQVDRALQRVRADYDAGGASAVAQGSQACFQRLSATPNYADLDYCLAYDQFGAAMMRRLNGGPPAPDSWFGGAETRARAAAASVLGPQGDADARVLDVRRLSAEASRRALASAAPADPGGSPAPTVSSDPPEPVQVAEAPTPPPPPPTPEPARAPEPAPPPRAAPEAEDAPEPPRAPSVPVRRPRPAPPPERADADDNVRPSFNCRYARSTSERMVCSEPELAAADRRLHDTFEDAMARARNPRRLRLEQDRWLARREAAAPDYAAVLDAYEARIDQLERRY